MENNIMKNIINKIKNAINNWLGTEEVLRKYIDEIHRVTHSYIYDFKNANSEEIEILSKKIFKLDNATTEEIESLKNKIEGLEMQVENLEGDLYQFNGYEINKRIKWAENEIKYNHMEHLALKEVYNKYIMQLDNVDYFDYNHETAEDIKPKYKDVDNKYDYDYQVAAIKPLKKTAAKKAPAKKTAAKKK